MSESQIEEAPGVGTSPTLKEAKPEELRIAGVEPSSEALLTQVEALASSPAVIRSIQLIAFSRATCMTG